MDYVEAVQELEKKWTPDRLRGYILDYLRESCMWVNEKKIEVENENAEARRKGLSYTERKKYSTQLTALDELFLKWRNRGIKYKMATVRVQDLVHPDDLELIHSNGFEWHLRSAIIW